MRTTLIFFLKFLYYAIAFIRSISTIPAILCMIIPSLIDSIFLSRLKFMIRVLILGKRKRIKLLDRVKRLRALERWEKRETEKIEEKKKARETALEKVNLLFQGIHLMYKENK